MSESPDSGPRRDWTPPRFDLGPETTTPSAAPRTPQDSPAPPAVPRVPGRRGGGPRRISAARRDTATLLGLVFLIVASLSFILFTAIVLPAFLGVVAVVMGLLAFGALHYLLWGFWLDGGVSAHPEDQQHDAPTPE